jgi:hypothetical protein
VTQPTPSTYLRLLEEPTGGVYLCAYSAMEPGVPEPYIARLRGFDLTYGYKRSFLGKRYEVHLKERTYLQQRVSLGELFEDDPLEVRVGLPGNRSRVKLYVQFKRRPQPQYFIVEERVIRALLLGKTPPPQRTAPVRLETTTLPPSTSPVLVDAPRRIRFSREETRDA